MHQVRTAKTEALLLGDFNAKASLWGMDNTDRRGEVLAE